MITKEELDVELRARGKQLSEADFDARIKRIDIDNNGNIDFYEFLVAMAEILEKLATALQQAFNLWDTNGDGMISLKEYRKFRKNLSDQAIETLFAKIDLNKDGYISSDEFVEGTLSRFTKSL